jgi:serine/threonine protein kinase
MKGRRRPTCAPDRLRDLLDESLAEDERTGLLGHLDDCPSCRSRLEDLAAGKPWWDSLRLLEHESDLEAGSTFEFDFPFPLENRSDPAEAETAGLDMVLATLDPPDQADEVGRLGPYAISGVLGRGGMGVVLHGFDASLNRPVAIKVLDPRLAASGAAWRRFEREAQAAAAVVHENVIAIHAVDSWRGLPFLVMQYVPGRSLDDRLRKNGPCGIREALRIGRQVAAGLSAAHAQGLVHRDVKPANILLENGVERVKLSDFGLARAIDDASLTRSGVVVGSPQFMAPEQARGEPIDHRADLFGLGCVLYAMCAGRPPFRGSTALGVLRQVCEDTPTPIRTLNPDVPAWLEAIIERLLAKAPAHRFASAAEVGQLLETGLAYMHDPTRASPPRVSRPRGVGNPRGAWLRRTRWAGGLAAAMALGFWVAFAVGDRNPTPGGPGGEPAKLPDPGMVADQRRLWDGFEREIQTIEARLAPLERPSSSGASRGADPWDATILTLDRAADRLEREIGTPGL